MKRNRDHNEPTGSLKMALPESDECPHDELLQVANTKKKRVTNPIDLGSSISLKLKLTSPAWKVRTAKTHSRHMKELSAGAVHIDTLLLGDSMLERWKTVGNEFWQTLYPISLSVFNAGVGGDGLDNILWRCVSSTGVQFGSSEVGVYDKLPFENDLNSTETGFTIKCEGKTTSCFNSVLASAKKEMMDEVQRDIGGVDGNYQKETLQESSSKEESTSNAAGLFDALDVKQIILFAGTNSLCCNCTDSGKDDFVACRMAEAMEFIMNRAVAMQTRLENIIVYALPSRSDVSQDRINACNQAIQGVCDQLNRANFCTASKDKGDRKVSVEFCEALLSLTVDAGDYDDHVHFSRAGYMKWLPTLTAQITRVYDN